MLYRIVLYSVQWYLFVLIGRLTDSQTLCTRIVMLQYTTYTAEHYIIMLSCGILHSTVLYCAVLQRTVLYSDMLYCI